MGSINQHKSKTMINQAIRLLCQYYVDCETYDRTVCTGPINQDGIMPMNSHETGLIGKHARQLLDQIKHGNPEISDDICIRQQR